MYSKSENIKLYEEYLQTKDTHCLHQILLNHNDVIVKGIRYTLKRAKVSNIDIQDYYGEVYYILFKKLEKMNPEYIKEHDTLYYYLRAFVVYATNSLIKKDMKRKSIIEYNGLINNDKIAIENQDLQDELNEYEIKILIAKYISRLTVAEQEVIKLLYGFNLDEKIYTGTEIANKRKVSHTTITNLKFKALKKLNGAIISDYKNRNLFYIDNSTPRKY